nr:G-protein coupled receptor 35-like [Misgurnus anguillicaudatus]
MNNSTLNHNITESSINSIMGLMSIVHVCVIGINYLFGLPTHTYVIWLIVTRSESEISLEFFNLNLSVCEIGNCLNCFLVALSMWFSSLQKLSYFSRGLCITGRPLFQCLICVERYLAVVHPVTFLKFKPLRYKVICCTAAWIICLGSCLCCLFILIVFAFDMFVLFYSVQFFLFLFIQLFCGLAVLKALKQSGPGERGREREEENHMKRRAFHLILIITVSTLIAYVPSSFMGLFIVMIKQYTQELYLIALVCFLLAGFVQPVLYLHRAGKLCRFSSA